MFFSSSYFVFFAQKEGSRKVNHSIQVVSISFSTAIPFQTKVAIAAPRKGATMNTQS